MLVICPSRGRPGNIADLLTCWADAQADLLVCVDSNDPTLDQYRELFPTGDGLLVGARKSLCGWINYAAVAKCDDYGIIGFIGDDVRPRTDRWEQRIGEAMQPFGVVYGNDLHQGERVATHPFFDAEFVRRWRFAAPPGFQHLYVDNFWHTVGTELGTLTYLPDVILEHMHPHAGKAPEDKGYRRVNARYMYAEGRRTYQRYVAEHLERDLALLK